MITLDGAPGSRAMRPPSTLVPAWTGCSTAGPVVARVQGP
jgi:hypothetical protein